MRSLWAVLRGSACGRFGCLAALTGMLREACTHVGWQTDWRHGSSRGLAAQGMAAGLLSGLLFVRLSSARDCGVLGNIDGFTTRPVACPRFSLVAREDHEPVRAVLAFVSSTDAWQQQTELANRKTLIGRS